MNIRSRLRRLSQQCFLVLVLVAAGLITACSPGVDAPPAATSPPAPATDGPENVTPTPSTDAETAPPGASPAPTDEPDPLAGWVEYTSSDLGLTLYMPEGWEATPGGLQVLNLRQPDGGGWIQVRTVTAASADDLGLAEMPGLDAPQILDTLLAALREDGDFSAPYTLDTETGGTALAVEGQYYVLNERLLVAVLSGSEQAVVFTGHGPEDQDASGDGWEQLVSIYETIIRNTTSSGE